jgi:tetratricopeptide (TPR) repeat protein
LPVSEEITELSRPQHQAQIAIPTAAFALLIASFVIATLGLSAISCSPPEKEVDPEPQAPVSKIEEIPATTSSEEARAFFEEGQHFLDFARPAKAREKFRAAVEINPEFAYAYFGLSNVSLSFTEFQEMIDKAAANLDVKSDGERLLVEMNRTFLTNDADEGLRLARELTEKYPNSPQAWTALARYQSTRNEDEDARVSARKALELDPEFAAAIYFLANNYIFGQPNDPVEAEAIMRHFVKIYPDEAKAYEGLGDALRAQDKLHSALEAYTEATWKDPSLGAAQLKKGHVNSFVGHFDEARAAYDAGIQTARPESRAEYANYRAFTHIHEGDIQGSLDELLELADSLDDLGTPADQVKGAQVFALTNFSTAALHAGLLDQAAEAIQRRNELQREIGREVGTEDAARLLEANCQTWDGLLSAYRGDYGRAQKHAEEAARLVEDDPNPRKMEPYHWVLGMSALRQGDYETARDHLLQANHANDMYIRYHLALAEEGAGNTEEAKKLFKEVADFNFNSIGFALVGKDAAKQALC